MIRINLRMFRGPGRAIALAVALATGGCASARVSAPDRAALVEEVWTLSNEHFFDPAFNGADWPAERAAAVNEARRASGPREVAGIINDMLASLNTSHTSYYTPDDREYYDLLDIYASVHPDFIRQRFGPHGVRYEGVGILTKRIDGRWFIADILPTTPAANAGLLVGDEVIAVGGRPYEPIASFRGREGQMVTFTLRRRRDGAEQQSEPMPVVWIHPGDLYHQSILEDALVVDRNGWRIAIIRVRSYAAARMHDAVTSLLVGGGPLAGADADALVLDIRGGWGGANPSYLDLFNRDVPALTFTSRSGETMNLDDRWRKPVVLLVDEDTRSGKEIITHAFRTRAIGPVVGMPTAGAVVGGRPFVLSDGSLLVLAVSDVHIDGERLEGRGVAPEIKADFILPYAAGTDPQRDAALDEAAQRVANGEN